MIHLLFLEIDVKKYCFPNLFNQKNLNLGNVKGLLQEFLRFNNLGCDLFDIISHKFRISFNTIKLLRNDKRRIINRIVHYFSIEFIC